MSSLIKMYSGKSVKGKYYHNMQHANGKYQKRKTQAWLPWVEEQPEA